MFCLIISNNNFMFEALVLFVFIGYLAFLRSGGVMDFLILIVVILSVAPGIYSIIFGAPYIITNKKRILSVLKFGKFKKVDCVYELGCGDGRIIRQISSKFNVKKAVGYEYSFPTYLFALLIKFLYRTHEKIVFKNFWKKNFSDADVIILFLSDRAMNRFYKNIWSKLKKGTRVITNEFLLPNEKFVETEHRVYLYVK
jgi:hypothetical protein